jgi:hypothetical protein
MLAAGEHYTCLTDDQYFTAMLSQVLLLMVKTATVVPSLAQDDPMSCRDRGAATTALAMAHPRTAKKYRIPPCPAIY